MCVKHKAKWGGMGNWKLSVILSFITNWNLSEQHGRQYIGLAQFLSPAGLCNEVKLELMLP